jgi:hypothetical protein
MKHSFYAVGYSPRPLMPESRAFQSSPSPAVTTFLGWSTAVAFPFLIGNNDRVLFINILQGRILYEEGQTEEVRGEQGCKDPFEELDALFGE